MSNLRGRLERVERLERNVVPPPPASRGWLGVMEVLVRKRTPQLDEAVVLMRNYVAAGRIGPQTEYYCGCLLDCLVTELHSPGAAWEGPLTRYLLCCDLAEEFRSRLPIEAMREGRGGNTGGAL